MSSTNASTSAGVGGRPVRSRLSAAGQRAAVGLGRGRQARRFQLRPGRSGRSGCGPRPRSSPPAGSGRVGGDERPVRLVLGPLGDPAPEQSPSARRSASCASSAAASARSGRRSKIRSISSLSSGLPGTIASGLDGRLALVEPQVGLAGGAVRPVAGEAVLGQDRPDVAVVLDVGGGKGIPRRERAVVRCGRASYDGPRRCGGRKRGLSATLSADVTAEIAALIGPVVGPTVDFEAVEIAARRAALRWVARAVEGCLNADVTDHAGPTVPCACGGAARYAGRRPKTFTTALGPMRWSARTTTAPPATRAAPRGIARWASTTPRSRRPSRA